MGYGQRVWVFPDAERPPRGDNLIKGHESVIILNSAERDANIRITLFFEDRDPVILPDVIVGARRVRCMRTGDDSGFGSYTVGEGVQYAITIESDVPVVAQYGRAEPRKVSFYTTPGYFCGTETSVL